MQTIQKQKTNFMCEANAKSTDSWITYKTRGIRKSINQNPLFDGKEGNNGL